MYSCTNLIGTCQTLFIQASHDQLTRPSNSSITLTAYYSMLQKGNVA